MTIARQPVPDPSSQAPHQSPRHPSRDIRILCIDDDSLFRTLIRDILVGAGYTVLLASDGETGLNLAKQEQPDLVLLDLVLPGSTASTLRPVQERSVSRPHSHSDLDPSQQRRTESISLRRWGLVCPPENRSPGETPGLRSERLEHAKTSQTPSGSPGPPHPWRAPRRISDGRPDRSHLLMRGQHPEGFGSACPSLPTPT